MRASSSSVVALLGMTALSLAGCQLDRFQRVVSVITKPSTTSAVAAEIQSNPAPPLSPIVEPKEDTTEPPGTVKSVISSEMLEAMFKLPPAPAPAPEVLPPSILQSVETLNPPEGSESQNGFESSRNRYRSNSNDPANNRVATPRVAQLDSSIRGKSTNQWELVTTRLQDPTATLPSRDPADREAADNSFDTEAVNRLQENPGLNLEEEPTSSANDPVNQNRSRQGDRAGETAQATRADTSSPAAEEPIVLNARTVAAQQEVESLTGTNQQAPERDAQTGVAATDSTSAKATTGQQAVDPTYGLPLGDNVDFRPLPEDSATSPQTATAAARLTNLDERTKPILAPPALAPPTPSSVDPKTTETTEPEKDQPVTGSNKVAVIARPLPTGETGQYYLPPQKIIRLRATTPIGLPVNRPNVANLLLRDTTIVRGTHLLDSSRPIAPSDQGVTRIADERTQGIDEAIKRLTPAKQQEVRR